MSVLKNMPVTGVMVIAVIAVLFILAVILLFYVRIRYSFLEGKARGNNLEVRGFRSALLKEYTAAYKQYGQDVNTPAIISDVVGSRLSGLLLCERFLNNAVSLFVTLGLFGTFLGLSMSVSSLTELIGLSNTSEWLSVLDSVGGGLMSALSGMGVAFYTSLFGAGCSILLTILRTILSPQAAREQMETRLELWLDMEIAPTLSTEASKDDADLVNRLIDALNGSVSEIRTSLRAAAESYTMNTQAASNVYAKAISEQKEHLKHFDGALEKFNNGVHDFSEVDYNLRGSVERMDLAVRDLATALRELNRRMGGTQK
ncbi:MAG: hypothetical protein IJV40_04240 [Oscillospiraceae bacterium]|nr:hypothetical protein [Oscillospiraceae bacterium]